jgi:hypothetical protein
VDGPFVGQALGRSEFQFAGAGFVVTDTNNANVAVEAREFFARHAFSALLNGSTDCSSLASSPEIAYGLLHIDPPWTVDSVTCAYKQRQTLAGRDVAFYALSVGVDCSATPACQSIHFDGGVGTIVGTLEVVAGVFSGTTVPKPRFVPETFSLSWVVQSE